MKKIQSFLSFFISIIICQFIGVAGSFFTASGIRNGWYKNLIKPVFNPPSWVFGPVWTFLFVLMGISLFILWQKRKENKINTIIFIFVLQAILNILWSVLFFFFNSPYWAFVEIIFLWISIYFYIVLSWKISRKSAILFLPYLFWTGFAMFLNWQIWQLNG